MDHSASPNARPPEGGPSKRRQTSVHQAATQQTMTHAEIRTIIIGLMLAMLLAALDQTIIATALPTIGRELGDLEHLPWIVTAYLDVFGQSACRSARTSGETIHVPRRWIGARPLGCVASSATM